MTTRKTNSATARLKQDYLRLKKDPVPYVVAEPVPANILEWCVPYFVVTCEHMVWRNEVVTAMFGLFQALCCHGTREYTLRRRTLSWETCVSTRVSFQTS